MSKLEMPNLANATPSFLIDEMGRLRAEIKKLEQMEGYYKEALKAQWPEGEKSHEGENYLAERLYVVQSRLDSAKIKEDMDEDWMSEHSKEVSYYQFKVKLK